MLTGKRIWDQLPLCSTNLVLEIHPVRLPVTTSLCWGQHPFRWEEHFLEQTCSILILIWNLNSRACRTYVICDTCHRIKHAVECYFFCLVAFGSASFWDLAAVALLMLWRFIKNKIASLQTWHCYSYFYILVPNKWFCMKNKIPTKQFGQILRLRKGWKGCCDGCHNFQSHLLHFTLIGKDGVSAEWAWSILLLGILFARKIWIGLLKHAGSFWKGLIFLDRRWRETCPILLLDDGYALKSSKQLKSVWNSCAKNSLTWDMPKRRKKRGGNSRRTCKTQFIWVQGRSKSLRSIFPILCVASFSSTKNWRHCAIALSPCWVVISGQVFCWFELGFVLSKLPGHKHCAKERNLSSELQEAKQQDSWVQIEMRTQAQTFSEYCWFLFVDFWRSFTPSGDHVISWWTPDELL